MFYILRLSGSDIFRLFISMVAYKHTVFVFHEGLYSVSYQFPYQTFPSASQNLCSSFLLMLKHHNLQQKDEFLINSSLLVRLYQPCQPFLIRYPIYGILIPLKHSIDYRIHSNPRLIIYLFIKLIQKDQFPYNLLI